MASPSDTMHISGVQDPERLHIDYHKLDGVDGSQAQCIIKLPPMSWLTDILIHVSEGNPQELLQVPLG